MNLWVRTLRQLTLLSVALFFFSCEDESSILGFKNPNPKFQVGYVDIPLNVSSVFTVDSLITDLRPIVPNPANPQQTQLVDGILVGQYQDPQLGTMTARSFLSVYPTSNTALQSTAIFDSVTVQLRLNFYAYGFTGEKDYHIPVFEITGDTLSLFGGKRYYASSPAPGYSGNPIGEVAITVRYDSLVKESTSPANQQDTLLATGRLSDEFGLRIFNAIKPGFTDANQHRQFRAAIRGLALLPGQEQGVLGMNVINAFGQLSRVNVHYHTLTDGGAVADTLVRTLGFEFSSFTQIEADRANTELAGLLPYQSGEVPSDQRYVQSGAPVLTKLDLAPFYEFADTLDNVIINTAELVIDDVSAPSGFPPHRTLMVRLMNNATDHFLNARVTADRPLAQRYFVRAVDSYFYPSTETAPLMLTYDEDDDRYSGFMTHFTQSLFANKNVSSEVNSDRLRYLAIIPEISPTARFNARTTRTVFSKNAIKLRVYYTRANTVTE